MNVTHTKDNNGAQYKLNKAMINIKILRIVMMIAVMIIVAFNMPFQSVEAASKLNLRYNKKNITYTGKQVTYKLDNKQINNSKYPGIIIDGISLLPGSDVFNNKVMDTSYTYSSKTKKIVIKNDAFTVQMTVNSKTAYVNGVKRTMSIAPIIVNYRSTGTSKVMVPARFVSESLGYTYSWNSSISTSVLKVSNSMPLTLHYDNKWHIYSGSQGQVTVDNVKVNLNNMVSIIINNTAMVHAKNTFSSSSIKAEYIYNPTDRTVSLKKDDVHIVLTLGSKSALVNGVNKQLSQAPIVLRNKNINKSYIIVPGEDIANFLGYDYSWDSKTRTSIISTKTQKPEVETPGVNLPDVEVPINQDPKTYLTYGILPGEEVEYQRIKSIVNSNLEGYGNIGTLLYVEQDLTEYNNKDVYKVTSSSPFSNVSSAYIDEDTLGVTLSNMFSGNTTYVMNSGLVKQVVGTFDSTLNQTMLSLDLISDNLKYEVTLSPDRYTLYITVYKNYIAGLEASRLNGQEDTITVTSLNKLSPVITEDSTRVYMEFPHTTNGIGIQNSLISDGNYLQEVSVQNTSQDTTQVILTKKSNSSYVINYNNENQMVIRLFDETILNNSLIIRKPAGISISDITDKDLYNSKQFIITLPGDQIALLDQNPIVNTDNIITSVDYSLNSSGNTDIKVKTSKIQGYRYSIQGEYIYVQVDNPNKIYDKIVVLDAGHGGSDPGTSGGGKKEKEVNYNILVKYASEYFNSKNSNVKAYWTRESDKFITLDDRATFAKKVDADMFISLHMNAAGTSAKGIEVFYSTSNNKMADSGLTSKDLATYFVDQLSSELGLTNRKVKTAKFVVVHRNTVPAILIELGFMSNKSDLAKLIDPEFQREAAKSIYDATVAMFEEYPTGR